MHPSPQVVEYDTPAALLSRPGSAFGALVDGAGEAAARSLRAIAAGRGDLVQVRVRNQYCVPDLCFKDVRWRGRLEPWPRAGETWCGCGCVTCSVPNYIWQGAGN